MREKGVGNEQATIRDRVRELRRVRAGDIEANAKNWRTHPKEQREALQGVLAEIGYADALLVRELPDGRLRLIDGHLRRETTPDQEVPVLVLDITEEEADKLLLTLDPIGALAESDAERLDALMRNVSTQSDGLARMLEDLAVEAGILGDAEEPEREVTLLDQAIQLRATAEYCVVMCSTPEEWERLKDALDLKPVRRGGYRPGSPADQVGTQRVVKAAKLLEVLDNARRNPE